MSSAATCRLNYMGSGENYSFRYNNAPLGGSGMAYQA